MIRGIYTAAAGMMANMIETDTLADNLANVNTTGFKRRGVTFQTFPEMLLKRVQSGAEGSQDSDNAAEVGKLATGSQVRGTVIQFQQGGMIQTGNPVDLALEGDGFFAVSLPNGETAYTRAGNFTLNAAGEITTMEGNPVQGEGGGPITIPAGKTFTVNSEGAVVVDNNPIDKLKITRFENNATLEKLGLTLFKATPASQEIPLGSDKKQTLVHQGMLETSNANAVTEMIHSLAGLRTYETLEKNIKMHNDMLGKAVNEVGRVK
jgi:flagellar basal-body rod protein FlgG